jgi:hypothetical protein
MNKNIFVEYINKNPGNNKFYMWAEIGRLELHRIYEVSQIIIEENKESWYYLKKDGSQFNETLCYRVEHFQEISNPRYQFLKVPVFNETI